MVGAEFRPNGIVYISIDGGLEGCVSADLALGNDGKLRLIAIEDDD